MNSPDPNMPNEIRDEDYVYALEQLMNGRKPGEIRKSLIEAGHAAKQADQIVQYAVKYRNDNQEDGLAPSENQARGKRNMLIGGGFFVFGLVVTIGSMAAASERGGTIYLAWGAIVFGAIQFFRGVAQSKS